MKNIKVLIEEELEKLNYPVFNGYVPLGGLSKKYIKVSRSVIDREELIRIYTYDVISKKEIVEIIKKLQKTYHNEYITKTDIIIFKNWYEECEQFRENKRRLHITFQME